MYIIWRSYWAYIYRQREGILAMTTDRMIAYGLCRVFEYPYIEVRDV